MRTPYNDYKMYLNNLTCGDNNNVLPPRATHTHFYPYHIAKARYTLYSLYTVGHRYNAGVC